MVELQLLQRAESLVALLQQREPPPVELPRLGEPVVDGRRVAEERPRDEQDGGHGEHGAEHEREHHNPAETAAGS